jgi:hypothetical protein
MADESVDIGLHYETVECPTCHTQLDRVDRSPFSDDFDFYCDNCASRVEVSLYDPVVSVIEQTLPPTIERSQGVLQRAIEERLHTCDCGGHYRHDAPRRCHHCNTVVIHDEPRVDLFPHIYDFAYNYRDPTPKEQAQFDAWERAYVRRRDIWR